MSGFEKLGIVVVDYHTYNDLREFCGALLDADIQIPFFFLISLVEPHGMEAIQAGELAALFEGKALNSGVMVHPNNVGYNVAVNKGAKWLMEFPVDTSNMTLAFFNSDTRVLEGVLESCVDLLWSQEPYAAVGPRQINSQGWITAGGIFGSLEHPRHRGWMDRHPGEKYTDIRPDSVTLAGSAYLIKAPVWDEMSHCSLYKQVDSESTGAFLTCRHYYGETFLSYHLQSHDYKVVYNGAATMIHEWHKASAQSSSSFGERYLLQDRAFFRKACDVHGIRHD